MPLEIDSVYCFTSGGGTSSPRSTRVIADWDLFPGCGCTVSGPLQFVPGLPVAHCDQEVPDTVLKTAINR
jgi:hypothetical protein